MQAARNLVGVLVELSAGMKLRHDHFRSGNAFALVNCGRDAAAIVLDRHRPFGIERHRDDVAIARERLVDGVVHHLIDHVMETGAVIGVADIHPGPLAHGVQALQHLDRLRAVIGRGSLFAFSSSLHAFPCVFLGRPGRAVAGPNRRPELYPIHARFVRFFGPSPAPFCKVFQGIERAEKAWRETQVWSPDLSLRLKKKVPDLEVR